MIKTEPHSTLSPQMWSIKEIGLHAPGFIKKLGLICFPRICLPRLICCDQEPLLLLDVTEDYFFGVHIGLYQLDTRFVSLQNHLAFPSKVT